MFSMIPISVHNYLQIDTELWVPFSPVSNSRKSFLSVKAYVCVSFSDDTASFELITCAWKKYLHLFRGID